MNLKASLAAQQYKEDAQAIRDYILDNQAALDELMQLFLHADHRTVQKAAWPIGMIGTEKPEWFTPYFTEIIACLEKPKHHAVGRNIYRTLQFMEIPEEYEGEILELAMRDLSDPKMPIAIKVFSMTVAYNLTKKYPELGNELRLIIEEQYPYGSAGFKNRAGKILSKL